MSSLIQLLLLNYLLVYPKCSTLSTSMVNGSLSFLSDRFINTVFLNRELIKLFHACFFVSYSSTWLCLYGLF